MYSMVMYPYNVCMVFFVISIVRNINVCVFFFYNN